MPHYSRACTVTGMSDSCSNCPLQFGGDHCGAFARCYDINDEWQEIEAIREISTRELTALVGFDPNLYAPAC